MNTYPPFLHKPSEWMQGKLHLYLLQRKL